MIPRKFTNKSERTIYLSRFFSSRAIRLVIPAFRLITQKFLLLILRFLLLKMKNLLLKMKNLFLIHAYRLFKLTH
jgi:hypothetical protein